GTIVPSYNRTDCRVHTISVGSGGKLTLYNASSLFFNKSSNVFETYFSKCSKSGSSFPTGVLKAIPLTPNSTACLAAANVPECHIEFPRLGPILIPDETTSTFFHRCIPIATQSAGVPFTRWASISGNSIGDFL